MTILSRVWYILLQLFRFLVEIWILMFFVNGYFVSNLNPDRFYGIELDSKSENIFFIVRIDKGYYLASYSLVNDLTEIYSASSPSIQWFSLALSPFDNELAFCEYDLTKIYKGGIKIFNIKTRTIIDSLSEFNAIPDFLTFYNGRDNIMFIANSNISERKNIDGIFDFNRLGNSVKEITNTNLDISSYSQLSNFRDDSLLFLGYSYGTNPKLYKIGRNEPNTFVPVIPKRDNISEIDSCLFLRSIYCSKRNKVYVLCYSDLVEIDLESFEMRQIFRIADSPVEIDDIEVSNDCNMLYFTKSEGVHTIYRFDLEKQAMMPPIVLKYPAKMMD